MENEEARGYPDIVYPDRNYTIEDFASIEPGHSAKIFLRPI